MSDDTRRAQTDVEQADVVVSICAFDQGLEVLQTVEEGNVRKKIAHLRQYVFVKMSLQGAHFNPEYPFALAWQRCKNIAFESTKHQRFQLFVELFDF